MALVVTNGIFYILDSGSGNIEKVEEENKASQFYFCIEGCPVH